MLVMWMQSNKLPPPPLIGSCQGVCAAAFCFGLMHPPLLQAESYTHNSSKYFFPSFNRPITSPRNGSVNCHVTVNGVMILK